MALSKKTLLYIPFFFSSFLHTAEDSGWKVVGSKKRKKSACVLNVITKIPSLDYPAETETTNQIARPLAFTSLPTYAPAVSSLHFAALNNDCEQIETLISKGADIQALDHKGATPLHWAAGKGNTAAVKTILQYEKALDCLGIQDSEQKTPLHRAAGLRNSSAALILIQHASKEFINLRDQQGSTALLWATSGGNLAAVKALLKKGANPNAKDDLKGRTALHWALRMRRGTPEKGGKHMSAKTSQAVIRALMEEGADPYIIDNEGYSAINWARSSKLQSELLILEPGALRRSERVKYKR